MWIIQIIVASFWLFMSTILLFRENLLWNSVEEIAWFRNTFGDSTSRKWERFCRDTGLVCMATAVMLFVTLPWGIGIFGVLVALPPMIFLM